MTYNRIPIEQYEKLAEAFNPILFYVLNFCMVFIDFCLYFRNRKPDKKASAYKALAFSYISKSGYRPDSEGASPAAYR